MQAEGAKADAAILCRGDRLVFMQSGQLRYVHRLTEAKVRQLHVAVAAQQQIVWLDVPARHRMCLVFSLSQDQLLTCLTSASGHEGRC